MKKINLGIIGCGYWGPNFVRTFNNIMGCEVKYVSDLESGKLKIIKQLYPKVIITNNYQDILGDEDIDAVIIATPASTHYKLAKEALLKGKNVLVEKPIALKIKEASNLIRLAKEAHKALMVGHTFKFNPSIEKLKNLIKTGYLGKIYYLYSRRTNLGPLRKDVNAVWDLAPHDISIVNYILNNNPVSATAQGKKYLDHNLADVGFICLEYPDNTLAHIHVSWLDPKKTRELIVVGSKRMAVFDDLNLKTPISIYDKKVMRKKFRQNYNSFKEFQMIIHNGKMISPKIRIQEPLKIECEHFISCLRSGRKPLTGGLDGLDVLKTLKAIEASLNNDGRKVLIK